MALNEWLKSSPSVREDHECQISSVIIEKLSNTVLEWRHGKWLSFLLIRALMFHQGFLERNALRTVYCLHRRKRRHMLCMQVCTEGAPGNTLGAPACSGDAEDDKLQLPERQGSSDISLEHVLRDKLAGDALRQTQRWRDLSTRFGALKAPGREDSALCSSGSDSNLWLWLWLVSRQMSEQPSAAS